MKIFEKKHKRGDKMIPIGKSDWDQPIFFEGYLKNSYEFPYKKKVLLKMGKNIVFRVSLDWLENNYINPRIIYLERDIKITKILEM
jgi:hypothetical protein